MTMRKVTKCFLMTGMTGIQRGTRSWWWDITLECGHLTERYVPSQKAKTETAIPPKRVKCSICAKNG